jgi:sortase A
MNPQNSTSDDKQKDRDAATNVVRGQLDAIYDDHHRSQASSQPAAHPTQNTAKKQDEADHWQTYHEQWQNYYQKYYEQYYVGHLHKALENQKESTKSPEQKRSDETVQLKQKILDNAKEKAHKARKSRHFVPLISATVVVAIVAFLQYNDILVANVQAYVSPGAIDPQNIVVDPTANVPVGPEPKLIIPKINVDVPVIYEVGYDHDSQMKAMEKGVAHFSIPGANSVPGQVGNTVFSGHSSNDLFDQGDYKFIFAQLEKLQNGDTIYVNYNSVRYTYTITKKEVVMPHEVNKLTYPTTKPVLTLITCTPLGTAQKRLLVTAEQVAPDPSKATAASATTESADNATMTGKGPSALERLFGAR